MVKQATWIPSQIIINARSRRAQIDRFVVPMGVEFYETTRSLCRSKRTMALNTCKLATSLLSLSSVSILAQYGYQRPAACSRVRNTARVRCSKPGSAAVLKSPRDLVLPHWLDGNIFHAAQEKSLANTGFCSLVLTFSLSKGSKIVGPAQSIFSLHRQCVNSLFAEYQIWV